MGSHSMFDLDAQPSLIQPFDPDTTTTTSTSTTTTPPTPLILMHDGGGTIFSYHCLGELGRTVHGIANPRYESGAPWRGGIPEMARAYLGFVESVAPPGGRVILGGWSLGGLVALEMAAQAAATKRIRVAGIVMVDSVCPVGGTAGGAGVATAPHAMQWHEHTRAETREKVTRCFAEAVRMVGEWTLPVWEDDVRGVGGEGHHHRRAGPPPPPVVMLRARERVPVTEGVARVDLHRGDRLLGWGAYRKDLIREIIDIPGHHYNVFDTEDNLDEATEAIIRACSVIERLDGSSE